MPVEVSRCANCGIELDDDDGERRDRPDIRTAKAEPRYCCDGCAEDGPCTC